jgi:hypothetical protein
MKGICSPPTAFCLLPTAHRGNENLVFGLRLRAGLLDSSHSWLCTHYLATVETHCIVER